MIHYWHALKTYITLLRDWLVNHIHSTLFTTEICLPTDSLALNQADSPLFTSIKYLPPSIEAKYTRLLSKINY